MIWQGRGDTMESAVDGHRVRVEKVTRGSFVGTWVLLVEVTRDDVTRWEYPSGYYVSVERALVDAVRATRSYLARNP